MRYDKGPFGLAKTAFSLKYFNNAIRIRNTNEYPLIFGETIFVEVPKICEIYGPQQKNALWYVASFGFSILGFAA